VDADEVPLAVGVEREDLVSMGFSAFGAWQPRDLGRAGPDHGLDRAPRYAE
jgi:hypothetical protein